MVLCAVPTCKSSYKTKSSLSFHRFPKNEQLRKQWTIFCKKPTHWNPSTHHICSKHFKKEDFEINFKHQFFNVKQQRKLLENAIPTIYEEEKETNIEQRFNEDNMIDSIPGCSKAPEIVVQDEEDFKLKYDKLLEDYNTLNSKFIDLKKECQQKDLLIDSLKQDVTSLSINIRTSLEDYNTLNSKSIDLKKECQQKDLLIDSLKQEVTSLSINIRTSLEDYNTLNSKSIDLKKECQQKDLLIDSLKQEVTSLSINIGTSTPEHSISCELNNINGDTPLSQENVLNQEPYTPEALINDWDALFKERKVPNHWAMVKTNLGVIFTYFGDTLGNVTRTVFVKNDMSVEIKSNGRLAKFPVIEKLASFQELYAAIVTVTCLRMCEGTDEHTPCDNGFFIPKPRSCSNKCGTCQIKSRRKKDKVYQCAKRARSRPKNKITFVKNLKHKLCRYRKKISSQLLEIQELMKQCAVVDEQSLTDFISKCPEKMQEAIRACYTYAKTEDKRGMSYSNRWILECLLLRIKSRKAYLHVRNHGLLAVPNIASLNRYLKNLKPSYGFDPAVFKMLKQKANVMKMEDRRGTLSIDEMATSEGVFFDQKNLSVLGFTDLGDHTPEKQKNARGDHALVFMFQPFRGQWVQTVAAFLSKGAATGDVLAQLITECIILLENHGFFVDTVTADGATWNRSMWKKFGLEENEVSCVHPYSTFDDDEETESSEARRLWFCSDFSHLIKNLRNFIMSNEEIMTPDGVVKKKHFRAIIECDGGAKHLGLKIAHKLTPDHIDPKFYQKMNVNKAFDVFSPQVATAMKIYKNFHTDLADCDPTINFITRVHSLISAMTSRSSQNSLFKDNDSFKAIIDFLQYIKQWESDAKANNHKFMSENTALGFNVTLKATLEVMGFLTEKCGFNFLMTARLNQDALEGMFGMIRGCCGAHDKPDPLLFIQVYRLLTFYSLVKPPKGSNVEGIEVFETLLSVKDANCNDNSKDLKRFLDELIERGENNPNEYGSRHDHDYNVGYVNEFVQTYFSGFVAHKVERWTNCKDCIDSVTKPAGDLERDSMINLLTKGYLKYPSDSLGNLLLKLEHAVMQTVGEEQLNFHTFQHILKNALSESLSFVGCPMHKKELTCSIVNYYLVARTKILCKVHNKVYNEARKKEQELRKMSKLVKSTKKANDEIQYGESMPKKRKRNALEPIPKM